MYDIAIIGAGPAGASAAIFAAKAGKKTVLFDSDKGMTSALGWKTITVFRKSAARNWSKQENGKPRNSARNWWKRK